MRETTVFCPAISDCALSRGFVNIRPYNAPQRGFMWNLIFSFPPSIYKHYLLNLLDAILHWEGEILNFLFLFAPTYDAPQL